MAADNFTRGTTGGVVAGLLAGAVLFLFTGITSAASGGTFWLWPEAAASPFFGQAALHGNPAAIVVGLILHFAVSVAWGVTYGWTITGQPKGVTMMGGVWWAIIAWALMTYLVAPLVGAGSLITPQPIGRMLVWHVVYGLVLGAAFMPFQARASRPGRVLGRRAATA